MDAVMEEPTAETNDHTHVVKGKRTKRHRLQLHLMASSSSFSGEDQNTSANSNNLISPTTSVESSGGATEEEEAMANCLILLAQGERRGASPPEESSGEKFFLGQRLADAAATTTTTNGKVGQYAYECKTCNRSFPSFQALGGHRASHKKPKVAVGGGEEESQMNCLTLQVGKSVPCSNNSSNKSRVHECSICGSEFSSGQALGGHMRRHRAAMPDSSPENKKQKSVLSLDLNLPAPAEDERDFPSSSSSFAFAGKQALVFSAAPLVDCHY